jgi:integrase
LAVYDRWHTKSGDVLCREHSRGRARLYPSAVHGRGPRWQVRYYDDKGRQRKKSFAYREGKDPNRHADAFDAQLRRDLNAGDYTDPAAADVTLQAYAEDWRKTRRHDTVSAELLEQHLRLHVYEDPARPGSGRTPRGGVAIGQRRLRELARRPSLVAAWMAAMPLQPSTAREVAGNVSAVFRAAADDSLVSRNPVRAASVSLPPRGQNKARPWTAEQVEAMAAALPARYAILPPLGAGTGLRQGELFGLAAGDVAFLGRHPHVTVTRQLKMVAGQLFFAPLKNRRPRQVPLAASLAPRLSRHMELYPPQEVTLPWHDLRDPGAHGRPVTVRLVLSRPDGLPLKRDLFNPSAWWPAQEKAGITPPLAPGEKRAAARENGMHALRHTAASVWLRAGIDVVRTAAWLGDTPAVVLGTYAHLMPGESGDDGRAAVDRFFGGADTLGGGTEADHG